MAILNLSLFWGGLLGLCIGGIFVFFGVGSKPKYYPGSDKLIPMGVRRFVYVPIGVLACLFGLRDILRSIGFN